VASLSIAGYNSRKASFEVLRGAGGGAAAELLFIFFSFNTSVFCLLLWRVVLPRLSGAFRCGRGLLVVGGRQ